MNLTHAEARPAHRASPVFARPLIPPHRAASRATVRVMSYNVFLGHDWENAARLIEQNPADVICLQEVVEERFPNRAFVRASQVAERFQGEWNYCPLWFRRPRRIGNMTIVTRGRLSKPRVLHVSGSQPYGTWSKVQIDGVRFVVVNLHLAPMHGFLPIAFAATEYRRVRETVHLHKMIRRSRLPVIALGDYNTFWPSPGYFTARRDLIECRQRVARRHAATRPTCALPFIIDHIFVTPDVKVRDYRVIIGPGSDHRPVMAAVAVRSNATATDAE